MSLTNPTSIIYDINGNPVGVSSSMPLPVGALGQLIAGVDSSGFVQYLSTTSGSLQITGSVATNLAFPSQLSINNFPATQNVSGTVTVGGQVSVNNFPATQNVSGTVGAVIQNWPATIGISASAGALPVFNVGGPVGVSGSVTIGAWGNNVTASVALVSQGAIASWNQGGPMGVSGSINVYTSGLQGVSGTVGINNFPAVQAVSGTVTVGGQVSVNNFPATQNVSGSITVGTWGTNVTASVAFAPGSPAISVFNAGPVGVTGSVTTTIGSQISVNNFPATQNVSGTVGAVIQNWPATIGVSASVPLKVWDGGIQGVSASVPFPVWNTGGPVGVSGTVSIGSQISVNNFPATQNVSGSITVGTWGTNVTASVAFVPGSPAISVFNAGPVGVTGSVTTTIGSQISVNNFPATQNVSGTVTVGGQVSVNNFPATQNVSGSITVGTWGTNVTASVQGAPGGIPLQIWSSGLIGVSGTFTLGSQVSVNNFPATQNVSGTVGAVIQNWPATIGVSSSFPLRVWDGGIQGISASSALPVWNQGGPVGVTGSVTISAFPVLAVTGAYASGSTATAPVFPVLEGGVDQNNIVRPFRVDPQGRLTNQAQAATVTSVNASTANQTILAANPNRVGFAVWNDGSANMFLKFGAVASLASYTVQIGSKAYYESNFTYVGQVDAVFSTNTGTAKITELT